MTLFKNLIAASLLTFSCLQVHAEVTPSYFSEIDPEDTEDPWRQTFDIEELLYQGKTPFQDIVIFKHAEFGRMLALDSIVQTTEADEFIYHEMLNQVPLLAHPNPKRVLIIGGGDGGSLREVLRHKSVQKVTMVDLDGMVVDLCKKYLPSISNGAFKDPRAELLIQDGIQYVKNSKEKFDVIICDTTDPFGPGKVLFSQQFYADCKKCLNEGGILATQNGIPFSDGRIITDSYTALTPSFSNVRFYLAPVPTYVGGFMAFALATNDSANVNRTTADLEARLKTLGGTMRYYNPEIHNASFALPQYVKNCIPKQ